MGEINVTPMIDILLVLLIIFMVIVPVTPKGLDALVPQPPKNPQQQQPQNDRTIVVQVLYRPGQAPAYKINETDVKHSDLQPRLTEIYANRAERVMFVKGRRRCELCLHRRRDRYWQGGQRGSHRVDDAQDSGRPVGWPCPETLDPEAWKSTIFLPWLRSVSAASGCKRFQARPAGPSLKEKDTNMNGPARFWALAVTLTGMVLSMSGCNQLEARDQLNKGVDAYKSAHYEEAIEHFQKATELDPKPAHGEDLSGHGACAERSAGADDTRQPEDRQPGYRHLQGGSGREAQRRQQHEADRGHLFQHQPDWTTPRIGRRRFWPSIPRILKPLTRSA